MNNIFKKTELELIANAEYIAEQINDFQTIKSYMNNRFEDKMQLTQSQEYQLKQYQYVYDQSQTHKYSEHEIRKQLSVHFKLTTHQAWDVFRKAQELFSTSLHINKRFKVLMDIQWIERLQRKAEVANDMDAFAKLQKVKQDLYAELPDQEELPGDLFKPVKVDFQFNPEILGRQRLPIAKVKDLVEHIIKEHDITGFSTDFFEDAEIINENDGQDNTTAPEQRAD